MPTVHFTGARDRCDSPEAHLGLAMARLRQRGTKKCRQALLPWASTLSAAGTFLPGRGPGATGPSQRATPAFENLPEMLPGLVAVHRWLAALHS